jgi:WD40-like Beta Propeller Repeat
VFDDSGDAILWFTRVRGGCHLAVTTIGGEIVARPRPPAEFLPTSVNRKAARMTFWGKWPAKSEDPQHQSYWASFDFSDGGLLDACDGAYSCCDWSPDGRLIVYEKQGEIRLFDTAEAKWKLLAYGHDPTWNPDGKRIAYRSPSGHISLVTADGKPVHSPLEEYEILDAVRWSPDGRFARFAVKNAFRIPILMPDYAVVVCRVSDGKATTIMKSGGVPGTGVLQFYWIKDYLGFCRECAPGEEFH